MSFVSLPAHEKIQIAWPTPSRHLFDAPDKFFARTRVNADYGKPGFTRDCGKRFHRGCDIAPVSLTATGKTTRVMFTDCATGLDFSSDEPTLVPHDEVFGVFDGIVVEAVDEENASDFGKHVVIEHWWPGSGEKFFTLYGHLSQIDVEAGRGGDAAPTTIQTGQRIGAMGQTSRISDARIWMAIAPHLHFEVRDAAGSSYDPVEFLRQFLPKT